LIYSAIRSLRGPSLGLLGLLAFACAGGGAAPGGSVNRSMAELTNPFLGPDYSAWLIGPAARLATPAEIQAFLALRDDTQAAAFVQRFWESRDPTPNRPGNPLLDTFEQRGADADRQFSEAGFLGRRTDRGTIYVLYGPPAKIDHEVAPIAGGPPVELWQYGPTAPAGLDGKRPQGVYRFIKLGDVTVSYIPGQDPRLRRRQLGIP
jgi:GWxTD domain-containing protein